MIDRVGQHFGNYQLVKLLGQGGSAQVYLGKHRYLNSYAALKALNARIHPGNEHKFLVEAQTLADLRHPNIVHLLDFCIEDGTPVLIMDYAPKGSLRQHAPHGTQMPISTVVDFVAQIALGLQYAHNHHIIHRDVKPENILLDADDRLLLSDFGLSLLTPSSQELSTQDPAGTARYMAPEQLRGKPCFASDQYALAVMVYEWLCGELPFCGTLWEIWQQHLYTDPPPLRTKRPELPPLLEQVVLRALSKKPQDRFVSIQAFALALARASQTSHPIDDNDAPITASLKAVASSSPIASAHHAVTLPSLNNQTVQRPTTTPTLVSPELPRTSTSQNQNRARMLGRLRRSYSDLMSQSLQGAAWLDLGLASKPDAVQNAARLLFHLPNRAEQHLPPGTSIMDVYDEAEHELLILGEPGTGKSTLLLDLAQQLLVRAEQDQTHPLPIILPLSSWAAKRPKLEDWITEQLSQIYDVPRKLSAQWAEGDSILPLLDGLDEMEETARSACIVAINSYHREHLAKLVVCSRTTEYEEAASRHRLTLQGAIIVQPLTHKEVDAYLTRAGQALTALQSALKNNAALHDLATTPLMLNILILTYQGRSMRDLSSRQSLLLQQVWDDYVQRMTERRGNRQHYPLEQTRSRLGWLSRQMRKHNQTVFYLEQVQPDWLDTRQRCVYEWLGVLLPAIIIGALASILIGWFFLGISGNLPQETCLGGLLGGLLSPAIASDTAHTHRRWRSVLAISIGIGLVMGLSKGTDPTFNGNTTLNERMFDGYIYFVMFGLSSLLLQFLLPAFSCRPPPTFRPSPRRRAILKGFIQQRHLQGALLVALSIGLSYGLSSGLIIGVGLGFGPKNGLNVGLGFGLTTGLKYGLVGILISVILERLPKAIHLTERVSFSWRNLRNRLSAPSHLRLSLILTGSIVIFIGLGVGLIIGLSVGPSVGLSFGLGYGLGYGLSYGLSAGLLYWLLIGLYQSIAQERIEDQDRRVPNQGIRQSLRNSLLLGLISGTIIGGTGIVMFGLSYGLNTWLSYRLSNALNIWLGQKLSDAQSHGLGSFWALFIASSILVWLITGGLAVWRHCVVRFLLRRTQSFPWNASQFLDDATARILLRRVGGGYSFTHRLLLDHLADVETEVPPDVDESPTQSLYP